MESQGSTMAIILLIVGLAVGGAAGYFMAPKEVVTDGDGEVITETVEVMPLEGKTVQFGSISSTTSGLETLTPLIEEIEVPDLNEYADKLGYDIDFEILIDDAQSQAAIHLEKVQSFRAMDITIVEGGRWSSQASGALSYVNENDMLLFSPSSTSPLLMEPDDNLYRMCPTDLVQAPAIAEMLWSWGIEAVIIIQRGDAWADGIYNILIDEYEARGGVVLERIRYAAEVTEFSSYLKTADDIAKAAVEEYGEDHVGVDIISFQESAIMVTQAEDYPTLYGLTWFGSDGTARTQQLIDDSPTQSAHLRIFGTLAAPASSEKYDTLYNRYYDLVSQPFGYYSACSYDIAWVHATMVMETQSTEAVDNIPLIDTICYNMWGASGWNRLNEDGDRYAGNYDIWAYTDVDGETQELKAGYYDGVTGLVNWDPEVIGYTPPGH